VNSPPAAGGGGTAGTAGPLPDWNICVKAPGAGPGGACGGEAEFGGRTTGRWLVGRSSKSLLNSTVSEPARPPPLEVPMAGGGCGGFGLGSSNSLLNSTVSCPGLPEPAVGGGAAGWV
jgi:hypothetical protein